MTRTFFECRPASGPGWPVLNFMLPENASHCWSAIGTFLEDDPDADLLQPISVLVESPSAFDWDFYVMPAGVGAISMRAAEVLGPFLSPCFELVDMTLNGMPYTLIRTVHRIERLDPERSIVRRFNAPPHRVMCIERFAFDTRPLGSVALFAIPEQRGAMFADERVEEAVRRAKLRGFRFDLLCRES